jgi:thiol-disulfide isomerase/thioredoxin
MAQTGIGGCEVESDLSAELERARTTAESPVFALDERMAGFRKLIAQHPTDLFVNRLYLAAASGYYKLPLYDRLMLPHYEALYRENPDDPVRLYLYALATQHRDPARAKSIFGRLAREIPDSPWPHLSLLSARLRSKPPDEAGAREALEAFSALCPDSLDADALDRIASIGSETLKRKTAAAVRERITGQAGPKALSAWPALWQLEFQLAPASQHDTVRARVREDLARLRSLAATAADLQLESLRQGYALAGDQTGSRWAQEELLRRSPSSRAAADATIERWNDENPWPRRDAPLEDQREFTRKYLAASDGWIARWPNHDGAWRPRLGALMRVGDLPAAKAAAIALGVAAFLELNPDRTLGFTDPQFLAIAERLAEAGSNLDAVPGLVERGLRQADQRLESDLASKLRPAALTETMVRSGAQMERWLARKIMVLYYARTGRTEEARNELEKYRQEINAHDRAEAAPLWRGLPWLVDAAIAAGRHETAREALARLGAAVTEDAAQSTTPRQKTQHAVRESGWWEARAKLAAAEARPLDALGFYLRASTAMPGDVNPAGREDLLEHAKKLWASLGGSPEGFAAYRVETQDADGSRWRTIGTRMPDSSLLDGLSGKTTFINVWATWCGPCQAELPFVQRIFESLRDRPNVRVLTLNIDDNPGVIEGYMKQHGFTFPVIAAREYVEGQLKVDGIPRNWIVDAGGILRVERLAGVSESFVQDVLAQVARIAQP